MIPAQAPSISPSVGFAERGRSASRRQDGAGERRDSGRERGRKHANLLPVVAQADLDAGQLLDVAAAKKLMRARSIPAAPSPLTAASNSASLCSANGLSQLAHYRHPLVVEIVVHHV